MSQYSSQIQEEQQVVDRAYGRLDDLRTQARERLSDVRAAGSHGSPTQRTERDSFATMYEDRLTQLRAVEDRLVFGRLDDESGNRRYIGRIGLSDENHEPMLTDWRAEAARPFYEATPSHHGDIVMRRHITLHFREVVGIEDEVLDVHSPHVNTASEQGTLTGEGALLASLGSRRTGKMTDIVATIQGEQDRIIRAALRGAVIVQGGPGTGKTAVALHRAAYLLYTHRRMLDRSGVLVVGPSEEFLHYIDQVLPSLGETGVVSRTIGELIPGMVAERHDEPHVAQLKGERRMTNAIANAVAARERVPANLPTVYFNGIPVTMRAADVTEAIAAARRTRQPHNKARETFVNEMLERMRSQYIEQLDYTPEAAEVSDFMSQLRLSDPIRIALNLAWLPMDAKWMLDQMLSKPAQLKRYAPWLTEAQVRMLTRERGAAFTRSDIPLLDEAMELLGPDPRDAARAAARNAKREEEERFAADTLAQNGIGSGIVNSKMLVDHMNGGDAELVAQRAAADREWTYGHIVVDEAQELTAMDWRMLIRRCPSRSFTIVGDVAQTSALGGTRDWKKTMTPLFGEHNWSLNELTINYRNPQEVSNLASSFAEREGLYISTVRAIRSIPDSVQRLVVDDDTTMYDELSFHAASLAKEFIDSDGNGRVAVIVPQEIKDAARSAISRRFKRIADTSQMHIEDSQLLVCDAQSVKGLEYDAVIVAQPGLIAQEAPSRLAAAADLYVALTRPTQRLLIVRTREDENLLTL